MININTATHGHIGTVALSFNLVIVILWFGLGKRMLLHSFILSTGAVSLSCV